MQVLIEDDPNEVPIGLRSKVNAKTGEKELKDVRLPGEWQRVIPETWPDVFWLQTLIPQSDKYAPSRGDGVLVKKALLDMR